MANRYRRRNQPSWLRKAVAQALLNVWKADRLVGNRLCLEPGFWAGGVGDEWEAAKNLRESLLKASDEVLARLDAEPAACKQRKLLVAVLLGYSVAGAAEEFLRMRRQAASRGPWKKVTAKVARVLWRWLQDRRDGDRRDGDRRG
jgi:hypothetical protein